MGCGTGGPRSASRRGGRLRRGADLVWRSRHAARRSPPDHGAELGLRGRCTPLSDLVQISLGSRPDLARIVFRSRHPRKCASRPATPLRDLSLADHLVAHLDDAMEAIVALTHGTAINFTQLPGTLQLFFGIMGARWERKKSTRGRRGNKALDRNYERHFENWVRPLAADRPVGAELIENGTSYW